MKKLTSILLIDDDAISNMVTEMMLSDIDAAQNIKIVFNGEEAVEYLEHNPISFPELIFLDINMPLMNGFDFLNYWEKSGMTGKSKICMFTTSALREDKERAKYYSDVIAYVEKPLSENRAKKILQLLYESTFGGL